MPALPSLMRADAFSNAHRAFRCEHLLFIDGITRRGLNVSLIASPALTEAWAASSFWSESSSLVDAIVQY
jgi:hypothetical protein